MKGRFIVKLILSLLSILSIWLIVGADRSNHWQYLPLALLMAGVMIVSFKFSIFSIRETLVLAIVLRLICFLEAPKLSDDYFRFLWDGQLKSQKLSPLVDIPSRLIQNDSLNLDAALYENMNSKDYFTIYPPFNESVFWLSQYLFSNDIKASLTLIRSILLLCEIVTILLLILLCRPESDFLVFYAFNPLVIVEVLGNLHFEGAMLSFMLLAIYFQKRSNKYAFALSWAFSIISKYWPLVLGPWLIRKWRLKGLAVILFSMVFLAGSMYFIYGDYLLNIFHSIDLYFRTFEFNASIFYIFRFIGIELLGYDIIQFYGPVMAAILIILISLYGLTKKTSISGFMLWTLSLYLFLSPIVHPWYIVPILAFGILERKIFPLVWSITIWISYLFYSATNVSEPGYLLFLEYIPVFLVLIYDIKPQWIPRSVLILLR